MTLEENYYCFTLFKNIKLDFQQQFLESCGSWNRLLKKGKANGEEKWIGYFPPPTIWLSWFLLSKMVPMAGPWRYFLFQLDLDEHSSINVDLYCNLDLI